MLIIFGCGGHARSLADVAIANGDQQIIFVDPHARPNESIFGFKVIKDISNDELQFAEQCIIAIGDNRERAKIFERLSKFKMPALIANSAHRGVNAVIGSGVFVGSGVHIGPNAVIGENTIINTHCVIEHDCQIGKHSHISVNSTVAGKSKVGDFVMVGTGATIIDGISVCSNVTIGAGAVVVKDIVESGVYVGVPARKIKPLDYAVAS